MSLESTDRLSAEQLARLLGVGAAGRAPGREAPREAAPEPAHLVESFSSEAGPFAGGDVVDDFEIVREVGRGGMCIVYEARQRGLKRRVALKTLRPSLARSPALARRFRRESILAANLSHPNIVPIFSHGVDRAGRPYFTMELLHGESIHRRLARRGPTPHAAALAVAEAACDALAEAHRAGIIHRDVTPRNIVLEDGGRVRLVDFGIARDTTGHLAAVTQTQVGGAGTLAFMSPEQNLERPLDARTDIFSLGMTLYTMLTGTTAYRAANRAELALAFQMHRPRAPQAVRPSAGGPLGRVVMKMIAVDPADRYQDCDELAAALAECRPERRSAAPAGGGPLARAAAAAVLLAATVLAAYALGPLACHNGTRRRGELAARTTGAASPGPTSRPDPAPEPPPAADTTPPPKAKPALRAAPKTAPAPVRRAQRVARPAADPPRRREPPQAIVQWVYQPRPGRTFDQAGALTGRTTLADDNALSLGLYLFDPARGLVAYRPRHGSLADFGIRVEGRQVLISRVARPDGSGCVPSAGENAFAADSPPRRGYESLYRHTLKAKMVLFFRCAGGGYAKLRVVSVG